MKIGRYEIEKELGEGGMAKVYLARDPSVNRQVAVKVLPRRFMSDPRFRARFQREAEVIAALEHPAIVPVYDFGEEEDQPFIVMRYMPGGTLADRLLRGSLPLSELASIFERIGSAVDYAHQQGIIHRDLKPGNILFDSQGLSYLSDFGISKISETSSTLTGAGIIGTPAYMSPEQAEGKKLDGRSDIYSLGVVLFQSLTGELPYKADTPMRQAMAHILQPVPSLLDRKPDLPPKLERIIRVALDKSPNDRYQTAERLTQAIREAEQKPAAPVIPPTEKLEQFQPTIPEPAVTDPPKTEPVVISQTVPYREEIIPAKSRPALTGLFGAGGLSLLFLCVCASLIGGLRFGIIPNPFSNPAINSTDSKPEAALSTSPAIVSASPTLNDITETFTPTKKPTSTPEPGKEKPLFTAGTNMLCRDGPGTDYEDRWQLTAGEVVPVLAVWYEDSNWLLVDINAPASITRTDCCWVGGQGRMNVSLEQVKVITFLPDRLDCSSVK
jgi:serine/threonine protein kinase